ncbi:DNA-processing protein DprA [Metamycoplasma neophronis]|uniref:DNA processing protein, SMF family n=1 Tax=Metamycoplasma neophronis TaxID=872983 RepID=A0ABY2Z0D0_9BACT|nr:DNA-processing protein DprA [Metamycoplasma neophronis]TPR54340.1 DNA processing protein, SMF family [Metamycoplasma neophronis]
MNMNEFLIYFTQKYKGDWDTVYRAIKKLEKVEEKEFDQIKQIEEVKNKKYITLLDENYPKGFNNLYKPPFVIYYDGNINLLNKKIICVTGNLMNENGEKFLEKLVYLPNDYVFISEVWNGYDMRIITHLLKNNKSVIVVFASGIESGKKMLKMQDFVNKDVLFLSEYPAQYHITKRAYYARNRIVAGLADSLILLASQNNKLMPLVDNFIEQNKRVLCIAPMNDEENNDNIELINNGASLINSLNNI